MVYYEKNITEDGVRKPLVVVFGAKSSYTYMITSEILKKAKKFADYIESNRKAIHGVLRQSQSFEVVDDEISRSVDTLRNLEKLSNFYDNRPVVQTISVFLPLNLPLYSYVLFAAMPAFQSETVFVRPPERMQDIFSKLTKTLALDAFFPNIKIYTNNRDEFIGTYCVDADVVIFTGKYKNFLNIRRKCRKETLFLYNGVGHNPVVISSDADIDLAVEKTAYVKLYNNGQDCAGPDCILVHDQIADEFIQRLIKVLKNTPVNDSYENENTVVGPLFEVSAVRYAAEFMIDMRKKGAEITHGGQIDIKKNVVHPTIIETKLSKLTNYKELYSPIFFICRYENDNELARYFNDENREYKRREMYISLFGSSAVVNQVKGSKIISNQTIHDVERGVLEYGGYCHEASSISHNQQTTCKPLLIPREIHEFTESRRKILGNE